MLNFPVDAGKGSTSNQVQSSKIGVTADLDTQNQLVNWMSEAGNRTQSELNQIGSMGRQHG